MNGTHTNSNENQKPREIAIVGAGISGLLACKHAMAKGLKPIVFEARSCVGGLWNQTIESTKLQTPKEYFTFSDFAWPTCVTQEFPDHNQVLEYIKSYADHFDILPRVKFNSKVIAIEYCSDQDMSSWELWGGSGEPFSATGKWKISIQDTKVAEQPLEVYEVDFVILCIGDYSDLPNMPEFPIGKGPEVFANGKVLHSMEFAAMGHEAAAKFIKNKRVTVVGFQKSAIDIAAQVAEVNGTSNPCTMVFKAVHWTLPEHMVKNNFRNINRFSGFLIHKPGEGFFLWFLAILLSPLLWIFSTLMELYLQWVLPLKKYNMVPKQKLFTEIASCMLPVLPRNFYRRVEDGGIILKESKSMSFTKNGLLVDSEVTPLAMDIVIFATGYKMDEKLANIFASSYFRSCIRETSAPFYKECLHPRIPQVAIMGYAASSANLFTTEMLSKWLSHFLDGKIKLPTIAKMEETTKQWEECMRRYASKGYKRSCSGVLLQIYCHDQLCKDMGCNPRRKKWFLPELFAPYGPMDYKDMSW